MADRALFVGWGEPVRGREERSVDVFNEWVGMLGRMQSEGRIEGMDVTLLDPHGGDLGGFFMIHGSAEQCAALANDEAFRRAVVDATTGEFEPGADGGIQLQPAGALIRAERIEYCLIEEATPES